MQKWTPEGLIKHLDKIFDRLYKPFRNNKRRGSAEWLCMLFFCEALRGCMQSLREHRSLKRAIIAGKMIASKSIQAWSRKKPKRALRTEILVGKFLEDTISKYKKRVK